MDIITGVGAINLKTFKFSGGEVQVKVEDLRSFTECISNPPKIVVLRTLLNSSDKIMELVLAVDALRRMYGSDLEIVLVCPYLPYARQDRAMAPGESLALKAFATILNSLKLKRVEVWDVHSDVSLALVENVFNVPVEDLITSEIIGDSILVSPDAGSLKKITKLAHKFGRRMVRADKTRSVIDGSITGTVVYSGSVIDQDFLIVDDICDGGRTFIELAKELRKLTTGKIELWTTHGIYSKGVDVLLEHIDKVHCAVPFPETDLSKVKALYGGFCERSVFVQ